MVELLHKSVTKTEKVSFQEFVSVLPFGLIIIGIDEIQSLFTTRVIKNGVCPHLCCSSALVLQVQRYMVEGLQGSFKLSVLLSSTYSATCFDHPNFQPNTTKNISFEEGFWDDFFSSLSRGNQSIFYRKWPIKYPPSISGR